MTTDGTMPAFMFVLLGASTTCTQLFPGGHSEYKSKFFVECSAYVLQISKMELLTKRHKSLLMYDDVMYELGSENLWDTT